jgi:hypothetical protein
MKKAKSDIKNTGRATVWKGTKLITIGISSVVVIAAVGVGAFLYYNSVKEEDAPTALTNSQEESENLDVSETDSVEEVDEQQTESDSEEVVSEDSESNYDGWTFATLERCKVSFYYPSSWTLTQFDSDAKCADVIVPGGSMYITINGKFSTLTGSNDPVSDFQTNPIGRPGLEVSISSKIVDGVESPYIIETSAELGTHYYICYLSGSDYYISSWGGSGVGGYQEELDKFIGSIDVL